MIWHDKDHRHLTMLVILENPTIIQKIKME